MLSLLQPPVRLCDGLARRRLLQIGGLSSLGLHLPEFWRLSSAQAASPAPSRPSAKPTFPRHLQKKNQG
ncbi:MAG: hypothetical protein ACK5EN_02845 [Planctomyces sp.]